MSLIGVYLAPYHRARFQSAHCKMLTGRDHIIVDPRSSNHSSGWASPGRDMDILSRGQTSRPAVLRHCCSTDGVKGICAFAASSDRSTLLCKPGWWHGPSCACRIVSECRHPATGNGIVDIAVAAASGSVHSHPPPGSMSDIDLSVEETITRHFIDCSSTVSSTGKRSNSLKESAKWDTNTGPTYG